METCETSSSVCFFWTQAGCGAFRCLGVRFRGISPLPEALSTVTELKEEPRGHCSASLRPALPSQEAKAFPYLFQLGKG